MTERSLCPLKAASHLHAVSKWTLLDGHHTQVYRVNVILEASMRHGCHEIIPAPYPGSGLYKSNICLACYSNSRGLEDI